MASRFRKNPNCEKACWDKITKALDRAAILYQGEVKQQLSGPHSSKKLGVKTGHLRRSIQIDRTHVKNGKIRVGTNVKYSRIHEFGGVIKAKTAGLLHFKIENFWHTAKSVIIPARPFMRPALKKTKKAMVQMFKGII